MNIDGSIHQVLLDSPAQTAPHRRSDESQNGTDSILFGYRAAPIPGFASALIASKNANWKLGHKILDSTGKSGL
jgi:hypothetical protein